MSPDLSFREEKAPEAWKRTTRWKINMKPVTYKLERHNRQIIIQIL